MKLVRYITLIFSIAFILSYAALKFINYGLKQQQNDFFGTFNHILYSNENHEILVFGASIAKNNVNPLVLDSVMQINSYNTGIYAFGFVECHLMLENYLKSDHLKPKSVVYILQHKIQAKESEIAYPEQFFPYADNDIVYNTISKYNDDIKLVRNIPCVAISKYNDHLKYSALIPFVKKNHLRLGNYKGFEPLEGSILKVNTDKNKTDSKKESINNNVSEQQLMYLKEFCDVSNANGIKLYFVFPPSFNIGVNEIDSIQRTAVVSLLKKYDTTILDYSNNEIIHEKKCFYDRLHLNKEGAYRFSVLLANDLKY
jgi:hypothetical protein